MLCKTLSRNIKLNFSPVSFNSVYDSSSRQWMLLSSSAPRYHHGTARPCTTSQQSSTRLFASAVSSESCSLSTSSSAKSKFVLILGKPGGGKGTISNKILKDFPRFKHLSTGDLLRAHVREQTHIGKQAKKYMDKGALVPDDVMIQLVLHDAADINDGDSLLLDGFPRTMDQAVALDKSLEVDLVINLNIPVDTIVERISDR